MILLKKLSLFFKAKIKILIIFSLNYSNSKKDPKIFLINLKKIELLFSIIII